VKAFTKRVLMGYLVLFGVCGFPALSSAATIRVASYNIQADISGYTNARPGLIADSSGNVTNGGAVEGIGEEIVHGDAAQPIDILALQETTSNSTTVQPIADALNAFYGYRTNSARYAMSPVQGTQNGTFTSGNGPNAVVYNTNTLHLVDSVGVGTPGGSGNGEYRQVMRYEFAPAGVTAGTNNEFYVYVSHMKSGTGSSNASYRNKEAAIIRSDSAALPSNARVLYMGDFNSSDSTDLWYEAMIAAGVNAGVDPLNPTPTGNINWGASTTATNILATMDESSTNLRYRDAYQFMTSNVFYGVAGGLTYVSGTYHIFGNNGSIPYNGTVTSSTALNNDLQSGAPISASQLYTDLSTGSDHLPSVADYTIPTGSSMPTFTTSQANETCNGQSIGSITVTASGGSGSGYTYSDNNGSSFQSGNLFSSLAAGSYTVVVKDGSGSSSTGQVVTITQPTAVTFSTGHANETCNGQSAGSITVSASGGSGSGYTYSDGGSFQSSNLFTNLAAGSYTVVVKDGNGCSSTGQVVTITQPTAVTFTTSQFNETCNGQSIGSITVTASGGSGSGYTYSDNNGSSFQSGNLFSGLAASSYTIVVKDGNGCSSTGQVVTIAQPSAVTFTTSHANETCNGQSIGSITVTASGGSGSGYTYSDGGSFQSGNLFSSLAAGSYTIVVKDGIGCSSTGQVVTITQPTAVTFSTGQANETCNGQSAGSITVSASGGSGSGYTYSDGGTFQSSNLFSGLAAGSYTVVVKDGIGCSSTGQVVTITQPSVLSCSVSPSIVTNCMGNSQTFTANVSGGTPAYSYSWSGPNSFSATSSSITIDNLQPSNAGTYTVTVTDASGCQSTCAASLMVNPAPATPTAANNGPILEGTTLNLTASTVDGTTYSWTGPNGFTSTDQNPSISNAPAAASGTYSVTVTDSNGCTAVGSTTATVTTLRITSITAQGNDIYISWLTIGGTTNVVQLAPGNPGYNTNFTDIGASLTIVGGSGVTNATYEDLGGATNSPNQFYRVRLVP
jgi:endonuclease/exonuclease/phosphatase family metal-dependent hydrolase